MATRKELQALCSKYKAEGLLDPGDRCTGTNAALQALIEKAQGRTRAAESKSLDLPLANDLLVIIATFTHPRLTIQVMTLTSSLLGVIYAENGFLWRNKSLVETRGLVHAPELLKTTIWRFYYRLRNRHYFGDLYGGQITDPSLTVIVPGVTAISGNDINDYENPMNPDGFPNITEHRYITVISSRGIHWNDSSSQFTGFNTIPMDTTGIISVRAGSGPGGNRFYFLKESGRLYQWFSGGAVPMNLGWSIVAFGITTSRRNIETLIILNRDGIVHYISPDIQVPPNDEDGRYIDLVRGTDGYIRLLRADGGIFIPNRGGVYAWLENAEEVGRIFDEVALTVTGRLAPLRSHTGKLNPYLGHFQINDRAKGVMVGLSDTITLRGPGSASLFISYYLEASGEVFALRDFRTQPPEYNKAWKKFTGRVEHILVRGNTGRVRSQLNEMFAIIEPTT